MEIIQEMFSSGVSELLEYLSAHVLTCLVPAFFIAGGIAVFISSGAVLKYFGPGAKRYLAYAVGSVSGVILAVCSCTVLPLFAGIHRKGAGLGPAITFLYAGPAINLLAIVLTARKLGWELGMGRAVGAVLFSILIGILMAWFFRKEEAAKQAQAGSNPGFLATREEEMRPGYQLLIYFGLLVAILLWGTARIPVAAKVSGLVLLILGLAVSVAKWFRKEEVSSWMHETLHLARLIFPVLLVGVFVAGMLKVVIPREWISGYVGGNSITANFYAAIFGALMYFSTLTEVPILKALLDLGMGKGPALALLLAGPALSLPNMLAIRNIMGTKKTAVYISLVVVMATITGLIFGTIVG